MLIAPEAGGKPPTLGVDLPPGFIVCLVASWIVWSRQRRDQRSKDGHARQILISALRNESMLFSLYLRSFEITNRLHTVTGEQQSFLGTFGSLKNDGDFEEQLADAMSSLAPLVGLGMPGEAIGAGRISTPERNWQRNILLLMERAEIIILVPSARPGTLWEMEQIRNRGYLGKTVFLLPPGISRDKWRQACVRLKEPDFGWALPESSAVADTSNGRLAWLLGPWPTPQFFVLHDGRVVHHVEITSSRMKGLRASLVGILRKVKHPLVYDSLSSAGSPDKSSLDGGTSVNETVGPSFITVCPNCGVTVVPSAEGIFPCCRQRILFDSAIRKSPPAQE